MKRIIRPWNVRKAVRCLDSGGILAYPTEAVYGLGCDPFNPNAVMRLLEIKARPVTKGLILVASDFRQVKHLLAPVKPKHKKRAKKTWPGPVTWLWPVKPEVPFWLHGDSEFIAVRVSAHPLVKQLCRAYGGPIVSTSANRASHAPARSALAVQCQLGNQLDLVLHGNTGKQTLPSEIRNVVSGKIVRPGQ